LVDSNPWLFMTCWEEAMAISGLCNRKLACTRIKLGAFLEEQAVSESETLMEPGTVVLSNLTVKGRVAQLYFDAYATAVWTSAHAEYLAGVEAGIEEPPAPNVFAVPSAFTSMDLSDLYSRRLHPKSCPKATSPLLQLVARSTNPGARGWDPVLEASLKTPGIRRVITREYEVCLSGLHPQLHPALRPNWQKRFNIIRVIAEKCSNDATNACIMKLAVQSKEVVRRMLASTMANSTAMHTALSRLGHPVRHLCQPPIQLPHAGMEAAMVAFVQAGASLAAGTYTLLHEAVAAKFVRAQRRADGLQWAMGWLGANRNAFELLILDRGFVDRTAILACTATAILDPCALRPNLLSVACVSQARALWTLPLALRWLTSPEMCGQPHSSPTLYPCGCMA